MSENSVPAYEALSMYATGSPIATSSQVRYLTHEIQRLCSTNGITSYKADNLIAVGHNLGFTRDPTFIETVGAARETPADLNKLWRCAMASGLLKLTGQ
jgi:hypothetical protein